MKFYNNFIKGLISLLLKFKHFLIPFNTLKVLYHFVTEKRTDMDTVFS